MSSVICIPVKQHPYIPELSIWCNVVIPARNWWFIAENILPGYTPGWLDLSHWQTLLMQLISLSKLSLSKSMGINWGTILKSKSLKLVYQQTHSCNQCQNNDGILDSCHILLILPTCFLSVISDTFCVLIEFCSGVTLNALSSLEICCCCYLQLSTDLIDDLCSPSWTANTQSL